MGLFPLNDNFIIEPDLHSLGNIEFLRLLNSIVYTALLDSNASEHVCSTEWFAMQTATDNALTCFRG